MDELKQEAKYSLNMLALSKSDVAVMDPLDRTLEEAELVDFSFLIIAQNFLVSRLLLASPRKKDVLASRIFCTMEFRRDLYFVSQS